ncbi:IstB-like ATP binding protein [compost metagenome]
MDGNYTRLLGQLARTELLLLDDWGLEAVNAEQRNGLLEVMDERYSQILDGSGESAADG